VSGVWLAGSSAGGVLAICLAGEDESIRGVATLAAPADFDRWASDPGALLRMCREVGVVRDAAFPPDLDAWAQELRETQPLSAISKIPPRPLLLVHGTADDVVSLADARALADAAGESADLRVVAGAGHRSREDPRPHRRQPDGLRPGHRARAPPRSRRPARRHRPGRADLGRARRPRGQRVLPAPLPGRLTCSLSSPAPGAPRREGPGPQPRGRRPRSASARPRTVGRPPPPARARSPALPRRSRTTGGRHAWPHRRCTGARFLGGPAWSGWARLARSRGSPRAPQRRRRAR